MENIWCLIDSEDRVLALNPGSMEGCTDWTEAASDLTTEDSLTDEHGACLYKLAGGVIVRRSEEEIRADWPQEQQDETLEEAQLEQRVTVLEADNAETKEALDMILSGVTE